MGFLARILTWLLDRIFARPKAPSVEERLGAAQAKLEAREITDVQVDNAIAARRAAAERLVRDPNSARAPDKYSRD